MKNKEKKVALIVGITGQDGAYLAKLLLSKNYEVFGTSRDADLANTSKLYRLNIKDKVKIVTTLPNDFRSICKTLLTIQPTEIYNLAGQSSVYLSFDQPVEAIESIANSTVNWLEAIRLLDNKIKFFNAGSSELFGNLQNLAANENTPFSPKSPYAVAKLSAYWHVRNYRDSYNLKCCTGIMSNHESPLRGERFVTKKIVSAAHSIKNGEMKFLLLGNINIYRDWGWCPDYVEAIHNMLTINKNWDDFIISSGKTHSLKEFIERIFLHADLEAEKFIKIDKKLFRPNELIYSKLNPAKIKSELNWSSKCDFNELTRKLFFEEIF